MSGDCPALSRADCSCCCAVRWFGNIIAAANCWVISLWPAELTALDKFWRIGSNAGLVMPACCNACA